MWSEWLGGERFLPSRLRLNTLLCVRESCGKVMNVEINAEVVVINAQHATSENIDCGHR